MRRHLATIKSTCRGGLTSALLLASASAWPASVLLPKDMVIYAELAEKVTSGDPIGYQPEAYVWRDVEVGGVNVIVNGQEIELRGGYGQQESNSQVMGNVFGATAGVAGIPLGSFSSLLPGRKAVLEKGMVFNTNILEDTYIELADDAVPTLNFRGEATLTVGVVYQEITSISTELPLSVRLCGQTLPDAIVIEKINDQSVSPIPADVESVTIEGDCSSARVNVWIDDLKQHFEPGINRFSLTLGDMTEEVVLNVEI
jgi:hypothetical protein